ncbi:hypothetical protein HUG20_18050 [Salicibibacter cibi]|uniref:Uncharacterized protein n=1 Tax=Salicibibacter cibi TaxID=2743001 RepID=A0A7T6ZDP8_9BACI|nr:hypothetical protein [Salicibibacter cibi]QQK81630.1 hypothetical protein HUG20_18050 [Salicibibacter cibi]
MKRKMLNHYGHETFILQNHGSVMETEHRGRSWCSYAQNGRPFGRHEVQNEQANADIGAIKPFIFIENKKTNTKHGSRAFVIRLFARFSIALCSCLVASAFASAKKHEFFDSNKVATSE